MQRILITGGSGLLGLNWACAIRNSCDVVLGLHDRQVTLTGVNTSPLNLQNKSDLEVKIKNISPDIIVHAAGMTNVDECENNPDFAYLCNRDLSGNVACVANKLNIKLIHISTDHLFNGDRMNVTEKEIPDPVNIYGKSKLAAEVLVNKISPDALIVRTNFFGWGSQVKQSFSDWIINNLRNKNTLSLFDDVFYTPIIVDFLAKHSLTLAGKGTSGIIHVVGDERISKYTFAREILKKFSLPLDLIVKSQVQSAELIAKRPADMSLSNNQASNILGYRLGSVAECVESLLEQEEKRAKELYLAIL